MKEKKLSAIQTAVVEKIKILIKEYALAERPSFLYTQNEMLKAIKNDLCKLDEEYINKYEIPSSIVKELAKEVYDLLMERGEYDRAIMLADHYKL